LTTRRAQPDFPTVSEAPAFPTDGQMPEQVFSGGGELGERIRSFDWSSTPMGPISAWPQSLKTAVRILIKREHDRLLELQGVGRKTANIVVTLAFRKPGIAVDTHVH